MGLKEVRIRDRGEMRSIGVLDRDTFRSYAREVMKHLFRGGAPDIKTAIIKKSAAWGLDAVVLDDLYQRGVRFAVIPTTDGPTYTARLEDIMGPKGYIADWGHRPQYMYPLHLWTLS